MDTNNNGFKGKLYKVNTHVMELINENINLMNENIKLILENKRLREMVESLEKVNRECSGKYLVKEGGTMWL